MNRDWHNAPLQGGGRDAYDYGRTTLEPQDDDAGTFFRIVVGGVGIIGLMILCFVAIGNGWHV